MVFFGDKIVEAGLRLEEQGIQRPLGSIVRTQMEFGVRRDRGGRIKVIDRREGETAKARRNQGRRGSLAAADEKVAAAGVQWAEISRVTRLPCPTQSYAPRYLRVGPKSNSHTGGRQGWTELVRVTFSSSLLAPPRSFSGIQKRPSRMGNHNSPGRAFPLDLTFARQLAFESGRT
jgi:hypothetical protein